MPCDCPISQSFIPPNHFSVSHTYQRDLLSSGPSFPRPDRSTASLPLYRYDPKALAGPRVFKSLFHALDFRNLDNGLVFFFLKLLQRPKFFLPLNPCPRKPYLRHLPGLLHPIFTHSHLLVVQKSSLHLFRIALRFSLALEVPVSLPPFLDAFPKLSPLDLRLSPSTMPFLDTHCAVGDVPFRDARFWTFQKSDRNIYSTSTPKTWWIVSLTGAE